MSITLICNVTNKKVVWTNKAIIDAKIKQYGSLEAFKAAYVSKGANKKAKVKSTLLKSNEVNLMKAICEEGIKLSPQSIDKSLSTKHMSNEEYVKHYEAKVKALEEANASAAEIGWMKQRLERWRGVAA